MADQTTQNTHLASNSRTCTARSQGTPGKIVAVGEHTAYLHECRAPTLFEQTELLIGTS